MAIEGEWAERLARAWDLEGMPIGLGVVGCIKHIINNPEEHLHKDDPEGLACCCTIDGKFIPLLEDIHNHLREEFEREKLISEIRTDIRALAS